MDLGFEPPYTGRIAFNPWAVFNISGQFLCEEFALIAPGMPQTAARIHYKGLFGDDQWTAEAKAYFNEVVYKKNLAPDYPFGYGAFSPEP